MAPPAAASPTEKKKTSRISTDPYFGSRTIVGLTAHNITDFLADKEVTLIMFYDPKEPMCDWSKKHFLKAAKATVRDNHAYAAVNCVMQEELCKTEEASSLPFFKLYSRGKVFASYSNPREFTYFNMVKFVENAPALDEYQRPKKPC